MATMSPNIELKASLKGGLISSVSRGLGGESLIMSTYVAHGKSGEITFAAGQLVMQFIMLLMVLQKYIFKEVVILPSRRVEVTSKWQGMKGFFSGEGLILLKASGTGDLFFDPWGNSSWMLRMKCLSTPASLLHLNQR